MYVMRLPVIGIRFPRTESCPWLKYLPCVLHNEHNEAAGRQAVLFEREPACWSTWNESHTTLCGPLKCRCVAMLLPWARTHIQSCTPHRSLGPVPVDPFGVGTQENMRKGTRNPKGRGGGGGPWPGQKGAAPPMGGVGCFFAAPPPTGATQKLVSGKQGVPNEVCPTREVSLNASGLNDI